MAEGRLWEKILRDSAHKIRYEESHLVLLGNNNSGSRSANIGKLLTALQTGPGSCGKVKYTELEPVSTAPQVSPLLYEYLNVKNIEDAQSEKIAKMNVWVLEDPESHSLLDMVLKPQILKSLLVGVVLDFAQPWAFMNTLRMWLDLWHQKLGRVVSMLPLSEQDELVTKVTEYVRKFNCSAGEAPPLAEGVLTVNMGVPIIVICTNSDLCYSISKTRDAAEETLDYIVRSLRKFSLDCKRHSDAATLIYVSPKTNDNIGVLYEYLMHRVYGFHFSVPAQVLARESVFVPAGWDSANLISELDYVKGKDRHFEDVLPEPKGRVEAREEFQFEEDQGFLREMQAKFKSISRVPAASRRSHQQIDRPNPGGEISEAPQEPSARSQSTLEKFYKDLLDKGNKDQPSKVTEA